MILKLTVNDYCDKVFLSSTEFFFKYKHKFYVPAAGPYSPRRWTVQSSRWIIKNKGTFRDC